MLPDTDVAESSRYHTIADVMIMINEAESFMKEAHLLCRRKASEVLAFIITDTDRLSNPTLPHHLPLAFALKGYSMTTQTMRVMSNEVKQACHDHGINVLCSCYDGQWHTICVRDSNGNPLNRLELQKNVWKNVCSMKKQNQVTYLRNLYSDPSEIVTAKRNGCLSVYSADGKMAKIVTPLLFLTQGKRTETSTEKQVSVDTADDVDLDAAGATGEIADLVQNEDGTQEGYQAHVAIDVLGGI